MRLATQPPRWADTTSCFEVNLARHVIEQARQEALQDDMEAISFLYSDSLVFRVLREHWFAQAMLPTPQVKR